MAAPPLSIPGLNAIPIIYNTEQAIPLNIPGTNLTGKLIIARFTKSADSTPLDEMLQLSSANVNEIEVTDAANGKFNLKITQAKSVEWGSLDTGLFLSLSIFNADKTLHSKGRIAARVTL